MTVLRDKSYVEIAAALDEHSTTVADPRRANQLRIYAEDCRHLARAANGLGTHGTYSLEIAAANDRTIAGERQMRVQRAHEAQEDPELRDADAADALRDWLRDEAIDEIMDLAEAGIRQWLRSPRFASLEQREQELARLRGLRDVVSAMAHTGANEVDWLAFARHTSPDA